MKNELKAATKKVAKNRISEGRNKKNSNKMTKKKKVTLDVKVNGRIKKGRVKPRRKKAKNEIVIDRDEIEKLKEKMIYETMEKNKQFMMWSGVCFFMIFIVFAWVYNSKQIFQKSLEPASSSDIEWSSITEDLNSKIDTFQNDLKKIKSFDSARVVSDVEMKSDLNEAINLSDGEIESVKKINEIDELKKRIKKLEESLK